MKKLSLFFIICMIFSLIGCSASEPITSGTISISLSDTSEVENDLEVLMRKDDVAEMSTVLKASDGYSKTIDVEFGEYSIVGIRDISNTVKYEIGLVSFTVSKTEVNKEIILNISKKVIPEEIPEESVPSTKVEKESERDADIEETGKIIESEKTELEVILPEPPEPEMTIPEEPEQTFAETTDTVWVTETVNIRKEPNLKSEILGVFSIGQELTRIAISDDGWSKIIYDDQHVYCSSSYLTTIKPTQEEVFPMVYEDETAKITITKEWYENAWAYIAHLEFSDYTRLGTSSANGKYNNGYETTSHAAKRLGAIFAVNGCYSAPKLNYVVVRDGVIWNRPESTLNLPAIYSKYNGLFSNAWDNSRPEELKGSQTIQELVDAGLMTDSFCFGPPILINGEILAENNYDRAQRTFIGTNGNPGDIWIVVSDGRKNDGESSGLNYYQCAKLLLDKGCTFGICLDGGGSSTMVFDGKILNANGTNERAVVDFVYFK